jgi:hypothetical protein
MSIILIFNKKRSKQIEKKDTSLTSLTLMNPNNLDKINSSGYFLRLKEYFITDKFTSQQGPAYILEPNQDFKPRIIEKKQNESKELGEKKKGIFEIGFGEKYRIDLKKIVSSDVAQRLEELMNNYEINELGQLKIDTNGNIELTNSFFNVLLHNRAGVPIDNPIYNGGLEIAYVVKKGKDGIYRKIDYATDTLSLISKCYSDKEQSKEFKTPFKDRQKIMPNEIISLIVPGGVIETKDEKGKPCLSGGWDTTQNNGILLAVFVTNYEPLVNNS